MTEVVLRIMLKLRYINNGAFNTENGVLFHFFAPMCKYRSLEEMLFYVVDYQWWLFFFGCR